MVSMMPMKETTYMGKETNKFLTLTCYYLSAIAKTAGRLCTISQLSMVASNGKDIDYKNYFAGKFRILI